VDKILEGYTVDAKQKALDSFTEEQWQSLLKAAWGS